MTARRALLTRLLPIADLAVLGAAFALAYRLRFGSFPGPGDLRHTVSHLLLGLALLGAWLPGLFLFDLYDPARFRARGRLAGQVVQAAILVALVAAAVLFGTKATLASRAVFGMTLVMAAVGVWLVRLAAFRWLHAGTREQAILIVGEGADAERMAQEIPGARRTTSAALREVLDTEVIDRVIVATAWDDIAPCVEVCLEVGADVSIAAPLPGPILARAVPDRVFGTPVLHLHGSPQYRAAMVGKRAFDIVAACVLLPFAFPVFAVAALAVRLSSPGPVLFVQERVGLAGRRFKLYKLRTMRTGAAAAPGKLGKLGKLGEKDPDDPRVTRVGRFLRRSSIDELPQLLNVLRGDMSLVGPRPPLPEEVARYDRWQRRRLSMRPGLTGLWQVSGRSELGFDECLRLDLKYIDNWSPWLDVKILVRTVPAVLSGRGAR